MAVRPRAIAATGFSEPGRHSRLREWWEQEHVFGYGLIVPAIVLLATLVAFPFGMAIYFSLSDYWVGSPGGFVGLQNYRDILANETFRQTVQNSFVFTGIALSLKVVLGVWLAMLLARNLKFKRVIRGIVLLPFVIPTALSTLAWLWMFDSLYSVVNWTALRLHLISPPAPNWLGQSHYAMAAVIIVNVWRGLPFGQTDGKTERRALRVCVLAGGAVLQPIRFASSLPEACPGSRAECRGFESRLPLHPLLNSRRHAHAPRLASR